MDPRSWPPEFICPISRSVMADPVIVSSGQTYERRCIEAWMELGQSLCLKQKILLDPNLIIPNSGLRAAISTAAKSRGMHTPPLPPTSALARSLARRLIQEVTEPNDRVQELLYPDSENESGSCVERDEHGKLYHADRLAREETKELEGVEDDDLCSSMDSSIIAEDEVRGSSVRGSSYRHSICRQRESLAAADGRRGTYVKNSSSLHAANADLKNADERRQNHVKSSSTIPSLNEPVETIANQRARRGPLPVGAASTNRAYVHQRGYATEAANIEQDFEQFRVSNEHGRGVQGDNGYCRYARTDGFLTDPIRYTVSASGEALLEASLGMRELPPHLATKPSSYSSSEAPLPRLVHPSSSVDSLVQRLENEQEEVQEAAVKELRELTRAPENRLSLGQAEVIKSLLPLLKSTKADIQINATAAVVNLSLEKPNKVLIVRAGAIRFLVHALDSGFPEAQEHAAGAAFSLALDDANKHSMGVLNAIPPLFKLVQSGPPGSRKDAAMALYHLSLLQANQSKLVKIGAVPGLLTLAQSEETPDLASRCLLILTNVASNLEGRAALLQLNAITMLVKLLAIQKNRNAAAIPEQAAAVLVLLSKDNLRFKSVALNAGAQEFLAALVDKGSTRAQEKASALLAILRERSSVPPDESNADSVLSRQYLKLSADGVQMNSSVF